MCHYGLPPATLRVAIASTVIRNLIICLPAGRDPETSSG